MTALEWFYQRILAKDIKEVFEQAKEMERKQHGNTWDTALDKYEVRAGNYMRAYEDFDDYFTETYGSKGSDDHIVDTNEMVSSQTEISVKKQVIEILDKIDYYYDLKEDADWLMNEIRSRLENVKDQTEISDEEIEKASLQYKYKLNQEFFRDGAKWYREQLKQRQ